LLAIKQGLEKYAGHPCQYTSRTRAGFRSLQTLVHFRHYPQIFTA
jgi:hypothetical protein